MLLSRRALWIVLAILAVAVAAEFAMGRLPLGPDHRFGWWEGNIWSSAQSQRVADPYSFSHIVHGVLFYALLWVFARRWPIETRLLVAVALEAAWEVLENSPFIINRYRAVTIALGYEGDSVLNSMSDVVMMALGFVVAWRARPWVSLAMVVAFEIGMLVLVRDNLTLNIIMLAWPIAAIKDWQMAAAPK